MNGKNGNIINNREFKKIAFEAECIRKRLDYKQKEKSHKEFNNSEEIIFVRDLMLYSYPEPYHKDNILHLCEKTKNGTIKFFDIDKEFSQDELGHNKEDITFFVFCDNKNNYHSETTTTTTIQKVVDCITCECSLNKEAFKFLKQTFKNGQPIIYHRYEVRGLERKFVDLQKGVKTTYGQSTFDNFEK